MNSRLKLCFYGAFVGLLVVGATLALLGCTAASPLPATSAQPASGTTAVPPPSAQPPFGTPTFVPGPTLPVLAGTPVPMPREPITPANVGKLRELAIWGKGRISQVAYSPDGQLLAVGTAAGIWLYDAQSMAELRFIETERAANTLIFAPDGQSLTAVLSTTTLSTWNIASGQRLDSITFKEPIPVKPGDYWLDPDYTVGSVFSPDGTVLAAMTDRYHIGLWNTKSGDRLRVVDAGGIDGLHHLALSPKGALLAASTSRFAITVWDIEQGTRSQIPTGYQYYPLAFSPDSKLLSNGTEVWDVPGLEPRCTLGNSHITFGSVTFSPDGRLLAVGGGEGDIKVWEVDTCRLRHNLVGHRAEIFSLAFSPDGSRLASGSQDGTLRQWDTRTGASLNEMEGFWPGIRDLAVAPDGTLFISPAIDFFVSGSHFERAIYRQDLATGQVTGVLKGHTSDAALSLSADGQTLVSSEWMGDSTLVWDTKTGQRLRELGFATGTMALSPDGKKLVSGMPDGKRQSVRVLDTQTGKLLYWAGAGIGIDAAFSPDGSKLVTVGGSEAYVYDASTGDLLYMLKGGGPLEGFPVFSPDGKAVAIRDSLGSIWLWDVQGRQLRLKHPDQGEARYVAVFSPDGSLLASGEVEIYELLLVFQPSIYLWDARQGTKLYTLPNYMANISRLAFSPDGKLLISGALDGTVRLWGIPPQ